MKQARAACTWVPRAAISTAYIATTTRSVHRFSYWPWLDPQSRHDVLVLNRLWVHTQVLLRTVPQLYCQIALLHNGACQNWHMQAFSTSQLSRNWEIYLTHYIMQFQRSNLKTADPQKMRINSTGNFYKVKWTNASLHRGTSLVPQSHYRQTEPQTCTGIIWLIHCH